LLNPCPYVACKENSKVVEVIGAGETAGRGREEKVKTLPNFAENFISF
jgi:hypothetical protein